MTADATPTTERAGVRLVPGDLSASPEAWRRIAATHDVAVLVAEAGAVKAAELRELKFVLATAGIRPCAFVLLHRRLWPLRGRTGATVNSGRPQSTVGGSDRATGPHDTATVSGQAGRASVQPGRSSSSSADRARPALPDATSTLYRRVEVPAEGAQR